MNDTSAVELKGDSDGFAIVVVERYCDIVMTSIDVGVEVADRCNDMCCRGLVSL